jgi:hypothetical protein
MNLSNSTTINSTEPTPLLPVFNVGNQLMNETSFNSTETLETLYFDEPSQIQRIAAVSFSGILAFLVGMTIFKLLRKTDTFTHSTRHQKYAGLSAVAAVSSQVLYVGMTFREFRLEDEHEEDNRGLLSVLYYAATSFLIWTALYMLVLATLQRLQEFKPRHAANIVNIRVASFFVSCTGFLVDLFSATMGLRHRAILAVQSSSLVWLLAVCLGSDLIMVRFVFPIRLSSGPNKRKRTMV